MGVLQYVAKRVGLYLVVLFIGLTITFFLPRLMPTNPIDGYIGQLQARAGGALTPEAIGQLRESLEELYGLRGDLLTQYVGYLERVILRFDFGPSFTFYPQPVSQIIFTALPWTLGLLLVSTVIAWILGNMVGLVAGYFHTKKAGSALWTSQEKAGSSTTVVSSTRTTTRKIMPLSRTIACVSRRE